MPLLSNGERFPTLALNTVDGGTIVLPDDLTGYFGVVLIYRGSWCPYCNAQLSSFSRAAETLERLGVKVVALSVDQLDDAAGMVEKYRIRFPVAYAADVDLVAEATGAYTDENRSYLQSTGFVLDPEGRVITAVYSSGAIGRLVADDVAGLIRYITAHSQSPVGT